ncbi:hypothetical protein DH2020_015041 [Rehmannia glutinosa]|uniref:non-specific serine/threonine protein kinase n=1 Tax=Rehmannia glutinosa TaxID=99300 RepID=A0ABR0WYN1_REHGL
MASFSVITSYFVLIFIFSGDLSAAAEFDFGTLTLSRLRLLGDAHMTANGSVRLTRDIGVPNSGAGKVLYSTPVEFRRPGNPSPASFSTFFSFSVTNLNPSSIGGGLAFVISPGDEYVGDAGGFLGIMGGETARNGVVAVEFDTLMDVEFKDINGNHVGLDLDSMVSAQVGDLDTIAVDLKSGDQVNSWVDYSGPNQSIKVYGSTETHTIEWWSFKSSFDENTTLETPAPPPPQATAEKSNPPPQFFAPQASNSSITNTTSHGKCHNQLCRDGPVAVVGVVTAGAFFLAFCAFAFIYAYNKKFKGDDKKNNLGSDLIKMPKEFSYKELKLATKGFDSCKIIGHGAFGTVYRGVLPSTGGVVAVKRCSHTGQGKTEFLSELSIIGTLRHRNLVRLQGWCHEKGEILLVYDLMRNGSLDKALFESNMVLSWHHRRKILIGVASALSYLHQECENQVIHRDIKSSNIMLDEVFNARLGDFGLARQVEHDKSPDATIAAGTMGYLAPEYLLTGRATDKTDVFSFGAVVLEVVSGRRPIETGGGVGNLVEWVWGLHREGDLMAAVDPRLGGEFNEAEMRRAILVGLACSNPDPMGRPSMRGVVQMLLGDCEVPVVPRTKPTLSYSTSHLLMSLQDSVSDLNGMITLSTTSSENSFGGGGGGGGGAAGGSISGLDLV